MTKEEFLAKVVFSNDEERSDALFYIKAKGLYLHLQIFDYLTNDNNKRIIK